ncbi:hypothetical protein FPV67DRAFT_1422353 [Lyophyllum atratum]|nr:hypothetical protein FPV67DRAFT_1422353 [Lyophyllum atratum]
MDSTATLVNPSAIHLNFSANSMKDAVLSSKGQPEYIVSTSGRSGTRITIQEANTQRVLATIKRRSLLPDTVTFADHHGGSPMKLDEWMPDAEPMAIIETGVGRYHWKAHELHRLALYSEHNVHTPLAYMTISGTKPCLVMEAGTESFRDQILASLLIVEQNARMKEKRSSIAEAMNADSRTLFIR